MKILLLGRDGQLGYELGRRLPKLGETTALGRVDLDIGDLGALERRVTELAPDVIVNAVAYNAVDRAESEPELAMRVNAEAVGVLGTLARDRGAVLVHFSTDFVFDGNKRSPYTEADEPAPLSAYGRSKLAGERRLEEIGAPALTFRTSWVYSLRRPSFVSTMLRLARERTELSVVADQVGSPTWCRELSRVTAEVIGWLGDDPATRVRAVRGVYHAGGAGACSRFELVQALLELDPHKQEQVVRELRAVGTDAFPAPAARPAYSALDTTKLERTFGVRLLPWREALARALAAG